MSFEGEIKNIIFKRYSVARNCLRPESALLINYDLALLVQWLWSNKIDILTYISKTEIIIFRPNMAIIKH